MSGKPPERWSSLLAPVASPPRPARGSSPLAALVRHPWVTVGVLATVALVLGVVGAWMRKEDLAPSDRPFAHAVYSALRNFTLNAEARGHLAWPQEVARFLAPLATVWAAVAAFLSLTAARRRVARALRSSGHTVVCGLGEKGVRLARETLALGETVVAVERDGTKASVADLRAAGGVVLVGDAREPSVLERAGGGRASRVLVALPEDRDNLAIALRVRALAEAERPAPRPPSESRVRCHAHCADLELAALAREHRLLSDASDAFELHLFSRDEAAARLLVVDPWPDALVPAARAERAARVALVGTGPSAEAVVVRALHAPHVDAPAPLRFVVVAPDARAWCDATAARRRFFAAENGVQDLCVLDPVEAPLDDAHATTAVLSRLQAEEPFDAVVACPAHDGFATKLALALRPLAASGVPVFVRIRDERGLGEVLSAGPTAVRVFGQDDATCSRAVVVEEVLDTLARRIHDDYRNQRLAAEAGKSDDAQTPWESLDGDLVRSNLSQADHVPMKLAIAGRRAERGSGGDGAWTPDEVQALARLEHARWLAERVLAGWRYTEGKKDVAARRSPSLLPWSRLTEPIRDYDREPVRRIPAQLALLGLRVVRR